MSSGTSKSTKPYRLLLLTLLLVLATFIVYQFVKALRGEWTDPISVDNISAIPDVAEDLSLLATGQDLVYMKFRGYRQDKYLIKGVIDTKELKTAVIESRLLGGRGSEISSWWEGVELSFAEGSFSTPSFPDEDERWAVFEGSNSRLMICFGYPSGHFMAHCWHDPFATPD